MTIKQFPFFDMHKLTVEPKPRMVGGRWGYAFHRFPIKGGITPAEAIVREWADAINKAIGMPGYFNRLTGTCVFTTKDKA